MILFTLENKDFELVYFLVQFATSNEVQVSHVLAELPTFPSITPEVASILRTFKQAKKSFWFCEVVALIVFFDYPVRRPL